MRGLFRVPCQRFSLVVVQSVLGRDKRCDVVGPSTRRALNTRALSTANWLRYLAKRFEDEMERQANVTVCVAEMLRNDQHFGSLPKADGTEKVVTLEATELGNLILDIYRQEAELRRFAELPQSRIRRP